MSEELQEALIRLANITWFFIFAHLIGYLAAFLIKITGKFDD